MKLVILVVGVLIIIVGFILNGATMTIARSNSAMSVTGLLVFCLGASLYFIAGPVSRDEEQKWRFNPNFAWFALYLVLSVSSVGWIWLLLR